MKWHDVFLMIIALACLAIVPMMIFIHIENRALCDAIRTIEVHNTSHIRTPSVTILDGDWNVREEKGG